MKMRYGVTLLILASLLSIVGTAQGAETRSVPAATSAAKIRVPNVVGMRMDRATRTLKTLGLRVNEECSGLFGCVIKSGWWICSQDPAAGKRLRRFSVVVTYGERRGRC